LTRIYGLHVFISLPAVVIEGSLLSAGHAGDVFLRILEQV
jgi:hypothetical protein